MLSMASLISTNTSDIAHLDDFDEEDIGKSVVVINFLEIYLQN